MNHTQSKVSHYDQIIHVLTQLQSRFNLIKKALNFSSQSHIESERAAGHGNFKRAEKRIIKTQPSKEEISQGKRIVVQKVSDIDAEMKEEDTKE